MESSSKPGVRDTTPIGKHLGIHLSWNTQICVPSPTLHNIPFSMTCLALSKLCQAKEPLELLASKTEPEGKYLVLKTLYSRDSFSVCNLQNFFCQHSFIKPNQIYTEFQFTQNFPTFPMDFPLATTLTQPKFSYLHFNLFAQTHRQFKATHCKSRDRLNHCL